jgi:hypothetical protein
MNTDYSQSVVAIGSLARKLQKVAATHNNVDEIYKVATEIMFECSQIRQTLRPEPKTIVDYIKRVL